MLAHVLAHAIAGQIGGDGAAAAHPAPTPPKRSKWSNHPATKDEAASARRRRGARQDTLATRLLQGELTKQAVAFEVSDENHGAPRVGDILLGAAKIVAMVNSCFLNGCEEHTKDTKSRTKWWASKIAENRERDARTQAYWEAKGWDVTVFWEHENPEDIVRHIRELLAAKSHAVIDFVFPSVEAELAASNGWPPARS